eukprot:TRINITY_DN11002_c0_g1_i1.p1 TRINITY_DN11002_c0_g1~~TRINITY_DN11002_c0_g1_i1.p1  ORF type:complete len:192 (+),score=63.27 TRINITY_DN11002_c0_g1_i1:877-1452(+)
MGGQQSVIGLKMMETIYPHPQKATVFNDPKMSQNLEKEVRKRGMTLDDMYTDEEALDGDLDADIQRVVHKVWEVYDVKKLGNINKKQATQFFMDTFNLYCMRSNRKPKEVCKDPKKAAAMSVQMLSSNPSIQYAEFEQFVFCYDMQEALKHFVGGQGIDINIEAVQKVDTNQFANAQAEQPKLVYRDYPDD